MRHTVNLWGRIGPNRESVVTESGICRDRKRPGRLLSLSSAALVKRPLCDGQGHLSGPSSSRHSTIRAPTVSGSHEGMAPGGRARPRVRLLPLSIWVSQLNTTPPLGSAKLLFCPGDGATRSGARNVCFCPNLPSALCLWRRCYSPAAPLPGSLAQHTRQHALSPANHLVASPSCGTGGHKHFAGCGCWNNVECYAVW
jgi:hypothetical protein